MAGGVAHDASHPLRPQPFRGPDAILAPVIAHAPDAEPACPGQTTARTQTEYPTTRHAEAALRADRCSFDVIPRETWDRLASANPWSTPFSSWAFQRAWWDAYGRSAHDETLVVRPIDSTGGDLDAAEPIAIVPLMHRHEVEASDAMTSSKIRHGDVNPELTAVEPTATAIFFGASYHADYATVLAPPAILADVASAVVDHLTATPRGFGHAGSWDVVDLRRLRCGDPAADALAAAFGGREIELGWTLNLEREDVCPVVRIPDGVDFDGYLSSLDKKSRHEIRRKLRRAEAVGEVALEPSVDPIADLDQFIELHQSKWGADGLFPPTPGGDASRVFIRRWFEESGPNGPVELRFLTLGGKRIAAGITVVDRDRVMFYNAGSDPAARDLSPGVLFIAEAIRAAMERGLRRFDFLRGNEPYKYEWGSVDEPIQRLLVRRDEARA